MTKSRVTAHPASVVSIRRIVALFALVSILLIQAAPSIPQGSGGVSRRFHIECENLTIEKGDELTVARLSGGVTLTSRDGRKITASEGLVRVVSRIVTEGLSKEAEGRPTGESPINPEDIKYLELSGGVVMTDAEGTLTCDAIYSTDGGWTWKTRGRADFKGKGKNAQAALGANELVLDSEKRVLGGKGSITISLPAPVDSPAGGDRPISVRAGGFSYDLGKSTLTLTGKPTVTRGKEKLSASKITYHVSTGKIKAVGAVNLSFPAEGITVSGDSAVYERGGVAHFKGSVFVKEEESGKSLRADDLRYDTESGDITASGDCVLKIPGEEITLTAGRIEGNLDEERGSATMSPVMTRGKSTMKGEEIRFRREGEKIIVEVLGEEQTSFTLDPSEF